MAVALRKKSESRFFVEQEYSIQFVLIETSFGIFNGPIFVFDPIYFSPEPRYVGFQFLYFFRFMHQPDRFAVAAQAPQGWTGAILGIQGIADADDGTTLLAGMRYRSAFGKAGLSICNAARLV